MVGIFTRSLDFFDDVCYNGKTISSMRASMKGVFEMKGPSKGLVAMVRDSFAAGREQSRQKAQLERAAREKRYQQSKSTRKSARGK